MANLRIGNALLWQRSVWRQLSSIHFARGAFSAVGAWTRRTVRKLEITAKPIRDPVFILKY